MKSFALKYFDVHIGWFVMLNISFFLYGFLTSLVVVCMVLLQINPYNVYNIVHKNG